MAKTNADPELPARLKQRREDWIARVLALADQVTRWSAGEKWSVERHEKTITEDLLGTYALPELSIRLKQGEILLVPVGLHVVGGNGRVDLEAIPTLARVKLIGIDHGWELYADTNVPLRRKWNRKNFIQLAQDLLG